MRITDQEWQNHNGNPQRESMAVSVPFSRDENRETFFRELQEMELQYRRFENALENAREVPAGDVLEAYLAYAFRRYGRRRSQQNRAMLQAFRAMIAFTDYR